ncbi:flagellar hook-associated protein FlgK [Alkaliphilus metalliredigens QYMF]|uniref:Flagellar hook-associated protein 1 n=1 Tax=Alkaliphilus metalliredigens (strain QYMF) TaxID=293826 RepID=A6TL84_ALKMQ|nr:flagellar hook-associated protein FlgK [Alkaliphilus metalliredigens]ABR46952.1 flagellar hook-associated protein FlgK [Alkaliphilus metalliredigens QYMF]
MRSTFSGFNTATSGIFASQRSLDVVGHNIANANTPGYSRQRLEQAASTPMSLYGGKGMLGTGVDTVAIKQMRSEFLDFKYRDEVNALGYWETKEYGLEFIESIFNEPSDTSVATVTDELFAGFEELSKNPESITARTVVRERGIAFTNTMNQTYKQLEKLAKDVNSDINATVSSINSYADQIAELNKQIYRFEADGSSANDLRDRRNLLIDDLSKLVNVEVRDVNDGYGSSKMVVQINGQPLVNHDQAYKLDATATKSSTFDDEINMTEIKWANGSVVNQDSLKGELGALLTLRDGTTKDNKGIPFYIEQLNDFVGSFAKAVNGIHEDGLDLDGDEGVAFFTDGNTGDQITAKNIQISLEIDRDPRKIAAATMGELGEPVVGDGSNALRLTELRHAQMSFDNGEFKGTPEDFMISLIANLGVNTQEATRMASNQSILTNQIDRQRQSISGVSLDEEMANMVRFQHAYNASARMVTTMDEMIDVIINRMGTVGR